MVNSDVRGANLNGGVLAAGLNNLLSLEGMSVDDEDLAAGALGHVQLVAVNGHVHANVAGTAVGGALQLQLGDLEGLHVDCGHIVAAGHEHLAGVVIHQHGAGVLNPVRVALSNTVVSPNLLHGVLVEHRQGVVGGVSNPHGTGHVINSDAVRGNVAKFAVLIQLERKRCYFFNLKSVCVDTSNGGGEVAARTHADHPNLVSRLGIGNLVLTRQTLGNLRDGRGGVNNAAQRCGGRSRRAGGRGLVCGVRCCEGGRDHGCARDCEREGADGEPLQCLARGGSEVQCVSFKCVTEVLTCRMRMLTRHP